MRRQTWYATEVLVFCDILCPCRRFFQQLGETMGNSETSREKSPGHTESQAEAEQKAHRSAGAAGVALLLLLAAYAIAVVLGRVPSDRRIDGSTLGMIAVGCVIAFFLLRPEMVERITRFEALGWKVEMENRQHQQGSQLKDIELILPVLLPETERRHLINLDDDRTAGYKGNHELRTELRRLRSLKLIEMQPGQSVGLMTDGAVFDLGKYVRLTKLGMRWAERVKQLEPEGAQDSPAGTSVSETRPG